MKLGDSSYVYKKIVNAAEHPHLNIPETEIARKRKQQQQFLYQSLIFALGVFYFYLSPELEGLTHTPQIYTIYTKMLTFTEHPILNLQLEQLWQRLV